VLQRAKGDEAVRAGPVGRAPLDTAVRLLFHDLSRPFALLPADLAAPAKARVVELRDALHALHEARELLELGPLVVRRPNRNLHFDAFLDRRQGDLLSSLVTRRSRARRRETSSPGDAGTIVAT
jgi:hypothetical protein